MIAHVFIDGASRVQQKESTGESACAVVIYKNKKKYLAAYRGLGKRTNNEAEYEALIFALTICMSADIKMPIIYTDSQVVRNQVDHIWKCKSPGLKTLLFTVELMRENYQFKIEKVDRKRVWEPDQLCNEYLDRLVDYKEREVIHG